ncbi:hypothetical protein PFDSM3638_04755 [Pyrococcus furiosus DSM 3638]|uniref:Uncharacterized protein n=3 Tax=Pyrococcus furiosus TaxID=2261 RepID=A0A5C0XQ30_PYRFU|nr:MULTISPECIES: hypothetical protein [Pyrococcus]AAL81073.1 hypothetical protein PF0949 [Pyrococcus furiosus DSM 3638]AFN03742.1 hypothetical protein PFC_03965 [Pyrococcus furiosus COM1]QEK78615.1 hypothetical protein PFDSM3638_04755 [Pyrococcus furiosus DSM 3638]
MKRKGLALGMVFVVFLMIFTSYAGITTGEFWNDPLRNTVKGLFMGFGLVIIPFAISAILIGRIPLYVVLFTVAGIELLLAFITRTLGYSQYSRVFIEATAVLLPAGLIMGWVTTKSRF